MLGLTRGALPPVTQLARLIEVITVLSASGFGWLVDALGLGACVSLRCRLVCSTGARSCSHHVAMDVPLPQRLVLVLARLGPTFVKVGQLLATRTDYLPAAYADALRSLQDDVPPFATAQAHGILAAELGRPVAEVFAEFEESPVAAASLSQVHRARLPDGTEVAVKVQRPGIREQVEADLALLAWLARRLERRRGDSLAFRPTEAVAELAEYTRRELDFRNEARAAMAVARALGADDDVVIPRVHWGLTTASVLTTDFVHGHRLAARAELAAAGLDADRVLAAGARAMFRQIFEVGLFHADPHPGNLLLLDGDRVCFLDFGLHGRLDRRQRRRMAMVLYALVDGDYEAVGEQLLHLSRRAPGADVRQFTVALAELVESWYAPSLQGFSVARLLLGELGLGSQFGIMFPRELILLARALVHLEAAAAVVDPAVGFPDLDGPLLPDLRRALLPGRAELQELWTASWMDYLALALDLPQALPHLPALLADSLDGRHRGPPVASARPGRVAAPALAGTAAGLAAGVLAGAVAARVRGPSGRRT